MHVAEKALCLVAAPVCPCHHGRFLRAVPLGVPGFTQLRPSCWFLFWVWPAASRGGGWGFLLQPGHRLRQPALLLLLQPQPQPNAIQLQTQLGSVSPPTHCPPPTHPPSESWSDFAVLSLSLPLKFDRCSPHRVSSVTSSCWTGPAATPWPPPTTRRPTAGAAALSPRPRCTHTLRLPSTLPESPLPSPPPEMDTRLQAERAGRAPGSRRPWRPSAWALWGGQEPAAAFWI